jgi:hypothetical protein
MPEYCPLMEVANPHTIQAKHQSNSKANMDSHHRAIGAKDKSHGESEHYGFHLRSTIKKLKVDDANDAIAHSTQGL